MAELFTRKEIDKISIDILRQSKALDVFPTPIDKIVYYSDLVYDTRLDLLNIDHSFFVRASFVLSDTLSNTLKKIRGFLDRSDKTIYLDPTQLTSRKNFVKLHETGHQVLPWQRDTMEHLDDDQTLSLDAKEEFEAEANYFASQTLFQHDRFNSEMEKFELCLKAGMELGKRFGGSIHASLRRMVEQSNKRCALLVLNKYSGVTSDGMSCRKKSLFYSSMFENDFGDLSIPDELGYEWVFTQDYISGKRYHENGEATLMTRNDFVQFRYHYFNNNYNAFFFVMPLGESNKSKIKIFLTNV